MYLGGEIKVSIKFDKGCMVAPGEVFCGRFIILQPPKWAPGVPTTASERRRRYLHGGTCPIFL